MHDNRGVLNSLSSAEKKLIMMLLCFASLCLLSWDGPSKLQFVQVIVSSGKDSAEGVHLDVRVLLDVEVSQSPLVVPDDLICCVLESHPHSSVEEILS